MSPRFDHCNENVVEAVGGYCSVPPPLRLRGVLALCSELPLSISLSCPHFSRLTTFSHDQCQHGSSPKSQRDVVSANPSVVLARLLGPRSLVPPWSRAPGSNNPTRSLSQLASPSSHTSQSNHVRRLQMANIYRERKQQHHGREVAPSFLDGRECGECARNDRPRRPQKR